MTASMAVWAYPRGMLSRQRSLEQSLQRRDSSTRSFLKRLFVGPFNVDLHEQESRAIYPSDFRSLVAKLRTTKVASLVKSRDKTLTASRMVRSVAKFQKVELRNYSLVLILILVYVGLTTFAYASPFTSLFGQYYPISVIALQLAAVAYFILRTRQIMRFRSMSGILRQLIYASVELDRWAAKQFAIRRQRVVMRRFESCARIIERYPQAYAIRREYTSPIAVSEACLRVAAQFREYKTWVAMPISTTSDDLADRVAEAIVLVIRGEWPSLRATDATINKRANLLHRLGWIALAGVLIAFLVFIAFRQAEFGATGSILSSVVALIIVFVLSRLGIAITTLQQAADVASKMQPK